MSKDLSLRSKRVDGHKPSRPSPLRNEVPITIDDFITGLSEKDGSALEIASNKRFNPNAKDESGYTPLHHATAYGNIEAMEALKNSGANVHESDKEGHTALHFAATLGEVKAINILKKMGADFEAKDHNGKTPLYYAAQREHVDSVLALIAAGSRTDINMEGIPEGRSRAMIVAKQQVLDTEAAKAKDLRQLLGNRETMRLAGQGTSRNLLANNISVKGSSQGRL